MNICTKSHSCVCSCQSVHMTKQTTRCYKKHVIHSLKQCLYASSVFMIGVFMTIAPKNAHAFFSL